MKNEEAVREIITYYAGQRDPACQENLTSMLREILNRMATEEESD